MFRQTAAYSYQPPDRPGFRCHRRFSTILTVIFIIILTRPLAFGLVRMMMKMMVKMMVICIFSPQNSKPSFTPLPQLQLLHLYGFL